MMDTSCDMVKLCKDAEQQMPNDNIETSYIIGDEEYLPVKENSVDLVISCLRLHWTNDLPGAMIQNSDEVSALNSEVELSFNTQKSKLCNLNEELLKSATHRCVGTSRRLELNPRI
ncbi:putative methyltransferase [Nicotiana attenuata]|uniref:Methyltransferase n=1 Tax=Nicotiana attenuata TaxID=49451 RepID=A0A1J6JYJ3_NICAT|nr:putative methyltransferase [Nicotiana attenuata]